MISARPKSLRESPSGAAGGRFRTLTWLGLSPHRAEKARLASQSASATRSNSRSASYRGPGRLTGKRMPSV